MIHFEKIAIWQLSDSSSKPNQVAIKKKCFPKWLQSAVISHNQIEFLKDEWVSKKNFDCTHRLGNSTNYVNVIQLHLNCTIFPLLVSSLKKFLPLNSFQTQKELTLNSLHTQLVSAHLYVCSHFSQYWLKNCDCSN